MMVIAEDQFFSGAPGQITGPPNKEGTPSLEQQLYASSDMINRLKSKALKIIYRKLEAFRR